jgi:hypothetical protein
MASWGKSGCVSLVSLENADPIIGVGFSTPEINFIFRNFSR